MKMTIDSVEILSISIVTYRCQKTFPPRMKLAHARMTHIPSSMMKMTIDYVEISSISIVTYHCQKTSPPRMKLAHARLTRIPSSLYSNPPYTLYCNPSHTLHSNHFTFKYKPPPLKLW